MEKNKLEEEETFSPSFLQIQPLKWGSFALSYVIQNNVTLRTGNICINSKRCYIQVTIGWSNTSNNERNSRIKVICKICIYFFNNYLYNQNFKVAVSLGVPSDGHLSKLQKQNDKCFFTNFEYTTNGYVDDNTSKLVFIEIYFECQTMSNTMDRLLSESTYSDLKIVTKDKEFNVHKNILAVSNEVLAKMIESNMFERKKGIINFSSWDSDTVENVINYIYTGKCNIEKDPYELFKLAHLLQIVELQNLCKNCLMLNVNEENLINTLKLLAYDQYDLKDLDIAVKNFIEINECILSQNMQFIDFLIDSFTMNNITFALQFASKFKIEKLLLEAIKYFHNNSHDALDKTEIQRFLECNPTIMYKMYKYAIHQL